MWEGCCSDEAKRRCMGILLSKRHCFEGRIDRVAIDKVRAFILTPVNRVQNEIESSESFDSDAAEWG